jgi:phospholipid/cholesterol/gamma-HCH transport system ATP-binding protein
VSQNQTSAAAVVAGEGDRGEPVISLRNVVKRFGGQTVLDGITFDVYPGETMVVMGGSGSGKSTTLRCMIGTFRADEGEIWLFGQNICGLREAQMNEVRKKFGILFQSGALFNSMTIYDNVALPIREHTDLDPDIIDIQVQIKLELVGLREAADKFPSEISGGMKKRAGLARALALDPKVLFYDEPSAGLDPVTSAQIDTLIVDLSKKLGVTSVVVTHEMDSAFTIADRMAMLDKGKMLTVQSRDWYDRLRKTPEAEAAGLPETERLIRQFLRGDAQGPITDRKASTSDFAQALFGAGFEPINPRDTPSIQPSR